MVAFERLTREIFLADAKPTPLSDDDAIQAILDPSFEKQDDSPWSFFGPADGERKSAAYADTKLPDSHDKKVEHLLRHVSLTRGSADGGVRQTVKVAPGRSYQLSCYALPISSKATARIRVVSGGKPVAEVSETLHGPTKWWLRLASTFTVPAGAETATIELTDAGCGAGETVAYDWADLTPMDGLNERPRVTSVEAVKFDELPKEIAVKGRNFLPRTMVRIGNDVYPRVRFVSTKEVRVLVPQLVAPGRYNLTLCREDWLGEPQRVVLEGGLNVIATSGR